MQTARLSRVDSHLPWWTWFAPFLILHIGSEVSSLFKYAPGAALYYLPTSIGIILINWWGPKRVVPSMYLNAIVSAHLWDVGPWYLWPVFAVPETVFISLSWYLFTYRSAGRFWLPDFKSVRDFLFLGMIIPLLTEVFLLEFIYIETGERSASDFLFTLTRSALGEFISNFGLTVPVLYYSSSAMKRRGLLQRDQDIQTPYAVKREQFWQIVVLFVVIFIMSLTISFEQYWFLFGTFSLLMAIRFGFGIAIVTNTYIFLLTYLVPLVTNLFDNRHHSIPENIINIYLGTSLLYVFSAITGRIFSDLVAIKKHLTQQVKTLDVTNKELELINEEMDQFVYSVSHDLTAPLKSILGLVSISKLTDRLADHRSYFQKIELSVKKLDAFINEVLDYSRNKRQQIVMERVDLYTFCKRIVDELSDSEGHDRVAVDLKSIEGKEVISDPMRLKVILQNLLSNAFKFQKRIPNHVPKVKVSVDQSPLHVNIHVEDNGEGVPPDLLQHIFKMFYRGHENSKGSGLGLYIARESAARINAEVSVKSTFGVGSIFTVSLKK